MKIYCCGCGVDVSPRLTDGSEIYPHRKDLRDLPFWKCDKCGNFVGCHHKTSKPTTPLGCIPTEEIKDARKHIHSILDPLWKNGEISRGKLYSMISQHIGYQYHTAELRSIDDAREIYRFIKQYKTDYATQAQKS